MILAVILALIIPFNTYYGTVLKVKDGDTIDVRVEIWPQHFIETAIRLRGIDTPERKGKCDEEKRLAEEAFEFTTKTVGTVPYVKITDVDEDKFGGRYDATILVGNDSLAELLISGGYAYSYHGKGERRNWCEFLKSKKE